MPECEVSQKAINIRNKNSDWNNQILKKNKNKNQ